MEERERIVNECFIKKWVMSQIHSILISACGHGSGGRAGHPLIKGLAVWSPDHAAHMSKCPWVGQWSPNCSRSVQNQLRQCWIWLNFLQKNLQHVDGDRLKLEEWNSTWMLLVNKEWVQQSYDKQFNMFNHFPCLLFIFHNTQPDIELTSTKVITPQFFFETYRPENEIIQPYTLHMLEWWAATLQWPEGS